MKDSEAREIVLQKFYDNRSNNFVPINEKIFGTLIPISDIYRICSQLDDLGFIQFIPQWADNKIVIGWGKITASGTDHVEQINTKSFKGTTTINQKFQRLLELRSELGAITFDNYPEDPWEILLVWTAKATPVIRTDWANFFQDFQSITLEPKWTRFAGTVGEIFKKGQLES